MASNVTPEEAIAILQAALSDAAPPSPTCAELWERYAPVQAAEMRSWKTEISRWGHLREFFGDRKAALISLIDIDDYRAKRRKEITVRGRPTMAATRNREVIRLHHLLEWAVKRKLLRSNPIAGVTMEAEDNVRRTVLNEEAAARVLAESTPLLRAIMLTAYDSGMRRREVVFLRREQVDFETGAVTLDAKDTKTRKARRPRLTLRAREAILALPRHIASPYVFARPETAKPPNPRTVLKWFQEACERAGVEGVEGEGVWFHDNRRSFVTLKRRLGIPESVIMRMTGHSTREVFERYNVVSEEDLEAALETIEAAQRRGPMRVPTKKP